MVDGGLLVISYKTLFTLGTLLTIKVATSDKMEMSILVTSAVIPSTELMHLKTQVSS